MKYSIVELAPVIEGSSKHEALQSALAAAQEAESLGYHRIWYAEHHNTAGYAAQDPVSLIALAAAQTNRIRVGSGAVLLNHYSPFSVAERFLQLEALAPGRIDLGLGRATAGPVVDAALRRDRNSRPVDDFSAQVQEILAYYYDAFDPEHPFDSIDLTAGIDSIPPVWILGSSGNSAAFAGKLGLGYVFAGFINPRGANVALKTHEQGFQPSAFGPAHHQNILALNIVAAETEDEAHRLTYPARLMWQGLSSGQQAFIPPLSEADAQLGADTKAQPSNFDGTVIPSQLSGTVETLREQVQHIVDVTGATEIMVQDLIVDRHLRSRSRTLIAEALADVRTSRDATNSPRYNARTNALPEIPD